MQFTEKSVTGFHLQGNGQVKTGLFDVLLHQIIVWNEKLTHTGLLLQEDFFQAEAEVDFVVGAHFDIACFDVDINL